MSILFFLIKLLLLQQRSCTTKINSSAKKLRFSLCNQTSSLQRQQLTGNFDNPKKKRSTSDDHSHPHGGDLFDLIHRRVSVRDDRIDRSNRPDCTECGSAEFSAIRNNKFFLGALDQNLFHAGVFHV